MFGSSEGRCIGREPFCWPYLLYVLGFGHGSGSTRGWEAEIVKDDS